MAEVAETSQVEDSGQILSWEDTTQPIDSTALVPANGETSVQKVKKTKIVKRKRRPARPQVDPATFKQDYEQQTGTIFNVWYSKWSGGDYDDALTGGKPASGRCNVALDTGYTKADKQRGAYFCLFFARGVCPRGQECEYLHRLPNSRIGKDGEGGLGDIFPSNVDCFGRDKHSDYKDDMSGVGSFMRINRTLYVGRIHVTDDIEEVVARHFQEWGQVDRIRVLPSRGVAFVTYTHLANSEFAKEAMSHQSLDHTEILNVRWATVDPNPQAQKREARRIEEQAAEAIRRVLPASYVAELEGRTYEGADPEEERKRRRIEGSFGLHGYEAPDDVWYASEKAKLAAPEQQNTLEAPSVNEAEAPPTPSGLLGASTLSAMQGFQAATEPKVAASKASSGPLVVYGSDSDDD